MEDINLHTFGVQQKETLFFLGVSFLLMAIVIGLVNLIRVMCGVGRGE